MGYNHHWRREPTISREVFDAIVADFERVLLPLDNMGVRLAGPLGDDLPKLTKECAAFNGLQACGHPKNEEISIPFPAPGASGVGPSHTAIADSYHGMGVLLKHRTCDGDCSFEDFTFARVVPEQDAGEGWVGGYCKTGFRPYDLAVQCFLLIAKHHLRDRLLVRSGGADEHWSDPRHICYLHLGYPLLEFRLHDEDGLIAT